MERFPNELELISKIECPTQICYAAGRDTMLVESSKRYFEHVTAERELVRIEGASHSFTEEGVGTRLYGRTARWFDKFV